ncbi:acyltransferase family protein [Undibacterium sp. SXout20W]|uniref:acyltransferase family protein n=1 Tax=Undibacterium sp. SXout20W TaxID=3413051 RepID=UPI003BF3D0D6
MINPHFFHPKYRPDIDGLRAFAVLSVVLYHAFPTFFQGGFVGVDVFFVISGFLISSIIFGNLEQGTLSFRDFYTRRILRIFPALILILFISLVFGWYVLLADEFKQLGKHALSGVGFISNFTLWRESGYFDRDSELKPLLHLWSLGVEEQFYIVWPLLMWFVSRKKFSVASVIVLLFIASFVLNVFETNVNVVAAFYSPITRFWELSAGSLLAYASLQPHVRNRNLTDFQSKLVSFCGVGILVFSIFCINKENGFPGWWAALPVLASAILIFAGSRSPSQRLLFSNRIAIFIGAISFPLYLWHWPIFSFLRILCGDTPSVSFRLYGILISIALAWLTYKFIEVPFRFKSLPFSKIKLLSVLMSIIFLVERSFIKKTVFRRGSFYLVLSKSRVMIP